MQRYPPPPPPHLHQVCRTPFPPYPDPAVVISSDETAIVPGPASAPVRTRAHTATISLETLPFNVGHCAAADGVYGGVGVGGSGH